MILILYLFEIKMTYMKQFGIIKSLSKFNIQYYRLQTKTTIWNLFIQKFNKKIKAFLIIASLKLYNFSFIFSGFDDSNNWE